MDKPFKFALPSPNFNKNAKDICKPKPHFLTPSGMSLLPREKQPPPMYGKHGATVPPRYLRQHVNEQPLIRNTPPSPPPEKQYCEPCELELNSLEDLKRHRAQHEKCPVAGCLYKGHPSVMDKHINALHASGLFDKFKKLSTPEEIAAWRDERRKRYPTLANVLLKQKAQEQRQKRGERLEANKNRFGKVNDRKRAQPSTQDDKHHLEEKKPREDINPNAKNSKRNRKNKRNQKSKQQEQKTKVQNGIKQSNDRIEEETELTCGGIKMFRGTSNLKDYKHFSDKKKTVKNNALFGLVGMYGSDDDDEQSEDSYSDGEIQVTEQKMETNKNNSDIKTAENVYKESNQIIETDIANKNIADRNEGIENAKDEKLKEEVTLQQPNNFKDITETTFSHTDVDMLIAPSKQDTNYSNENTISNNNENSSDEAPEETPIKRSIPDFPGKPEKNLNTSNEEQKTKLSQTTDQTSVAKQRKLIKRKSGLDYRKARLRKQNTLLEKLLETDIRHERNVLLQCVRYVCENNFFGIGQNNHEKPG